MRLHGQGEGRRDWAPVCCYAAKPSDASLPVAACLGSQKLRVEGGAFGSNLTGVPGVRTRTADSECRLSVMAS